MLRFLSDHRLHRENRTRSGRRRSRFRATPGLAMLAALVLVGCGGEQSMFDPAGAGARSVDRLWLLMLTLGAAVFLVVLLLVGLAIYRGQRDDPEAGLSTRARTRFVVIAGILIPIVILAVVFTSTLQAIREVAGLDSADSLEIDVVGHQFWWEVTYPESGVVTANELYIPVGQPVQVNLTSDDVIHSFWIPQLHGKMDMMAGTTTAITLEAEEPGTYRGQCTQFCGAQHANMAFTVIAVEQDEFAAWTSAQAANAAEPPPGSLIARGQEIYLSSACVYCHAIRGTNSAGELGPDLTHLASRETLAAGTLTNTTGNLAAWILDPQQVKPGNLMPGVALSGEELQALLAYLQSLD